MADYQESSTQTDTQDQQTQETQETQETTQQSQQTQQQAPAFSWRTKIKSDYANAASLKTYEDNPQGLENAIGELLNLKSLLGHTKVPLPKDDKDIAGIQAFNKAMGIPDTAEGYGLKDAVLPDNMKNLSFDKKTFAETVHKFGLTPKQANGLWQAYTEMSMGAYNKYVTENNAQLAQLVNGLKQEWGDAYDTNVELGQMVINKFSDSEDAANYITASLLKNPQGAKFLAKIGSQFAENKIGDFKYQRFSFTPEQAKQEIDKIMNDPQHPYLNPKATTEEHDRAVQYMNQLWEQVNKGKAQQ
jgi:hypothetical protein